MADPNARKRLKKKMLDRWENEGGRIANDTTSADESRPTSEDNGRGRKQSSPSDNSDKETQRGRSLDFRIALSVFTFDNFETATW